MSALKGKGRDCLWILALILLAHPALVGCSGRPAESLSETAVRGHCEVRYAPDSLTPLEVERILDDCNWAVLGHQRVLQVQEPGRVTVWVYPDQATLNKLFWYPWYPRRGFFLNWSGAHMVYSKSDCAVPSLEHEIAHHFGKVLQGGKTIVAPWLAEGMAVALSEEYHRARFVHGVVAAALHAGCLPELRSVMKHLFLSSEEYTLVGSFCGFLMDRYGTDRFKAFYAGMSSKLSFGLDLEALEQEWREYLRGTEFTEDDLAEALARFCRATGEEGHPRLAKPDPKVERVIERFKAHRDWQGLIEYGLSGIAAKADVATGMRILGATNRAFDMLERYEEGFKWLQKAEAELPQHMGFLRYLQLVKCIQLGLNDQARVLLDWLVEHGSVGEDVAELYALIIDSPAARVALLAMDEKNLEKKLELTRQAVSRDRRLAPLYCHLIENYPSGIGEVEARELVTACVESTASGPERWRLSALTWLAKRAECSGDLRSAHLYLAEALKNTETHRTRFMLEKEIERISFRVRGRQEILPSQADSGSDPLPLAGIR